MVERILGSNVARAVIRSSHAPKPGSRLFLNEGIEAVVLERVEDLYTLKFEHESNVFELLERFGTLPLPPYITRTATEADEARYQTVYAREAGAVAAPTAGLHFDECMFVTLEKMGVVMANVTLHVGLG